MVSSSMPQPLRSFLFWLVLTFAAAALGGVGSAEAPTFYTSLALPTWAPAPSVFGPVWTVLYALMAVSVWLAWRARSPGGRLLPFVLFVVQLVLNALWSWVFFHFKAGGPAFVHILVLWVAIVCTAVLLGRLSRPAGWLFVPYILWVTFAAYLNFTVWQMNPVLLGGQLG